jgi:thioesterase domain-containing protein
MDNKSLRDFLHREIPLSQFMGIEITHADDQSVEIRGPLEPSRNHLDTAFGGSIGAILILSCYTWLFHRLIGAGFECHVLIKEGHTNYMRPVTEDLIATCTAPSNDEYDKFLETFTRKGLARIELTAKLGESAEFKGVFVAQKSKHE